MYVGIMIHCLVIKNTPDSSGYPLHALYFCGIRRQIAARNFPSWCEGVSADAEGEIEEKVEKQKRRQME